MSNLDKIFQFLWSTQLLQLKCCESMVPVLGLSVPVPVGLLFACIRFALEFRGMFHKGIGYRVFSWDRFTCICFLYYLDTAK